MAKSTTSIFYGKSHNQPGQKNQLESKQLRDSLKHGLVTARVGKMQTVKHSGTICSNAFTG